MIERLASHIEQSVRSFVEANGVLAERRVSGDSDGDAAEDGDGFLECERIEASIGTGHPGFHSGEEPEWQAETFGTVPAGFGKELARHVAGMIAESERRHADRLAAYHAGGDANASSKAPTTAGAS